MSKPKYILFQVLPVLIGQLLLSALMVGVFAALGYFDTGVVYGAAAGALIATSVKSAEVIAFEDLGTEAIRELQVEDLPLIVAIDAAHIHRAVVVE